MKVSLLSKKTPWQKEWDDLLKKEAAFASRRKKGAAGTLIARLDSVVPEKLGDTLKTAFCRGFALVFQKGTGVIEKTYSKEKKKADFQINAYACGLKQDRRSIGNFTRQARSSRKVNLLISGAEGIGLGLVGAGIPDIPLFIAVILKAVYETALSFGFEYETDREKIFVLKIIEVAVRTDEDFAEGNRQIDDMIEALRDGTFPPAGRSDVDAAAEAAAGALATEMIYTKFLQGQLIIGVIGGLSDPVYLNRISNYAALKYRRRFLIDKVSSKPSSL